MERQQNFYHYLCKFLVQFAPFFLCHSLDVTLTPLSLPLSHSPSRYVVATDRVLFMTKDGSKAWEIKDYLITQEECTNVNFEHLSFPCKGTEKGAEGYQTPKDEL